MTVAMEKRLTWLGISFFYEKSGWHSLIQDPLRSYLSSEEVQSRAIVYTVAFNSDRGDNIRLNIWAELLDADELLLKCHGHFTDFFSKNPIPRPGGSWTTGDHFFLPFPANSIQYGVYRTPKVIDDHTVELFALDKRLSDCLLMVFCEPFSTGNLLIIAALLSLTVVWAITQITGCSGPVEQSGYMRFRAMKGGRNYLEDAPMRNMFEEVFQANRELLTTMNKEIYAGFDRCEYLPEWVETWKGNCIEQLRKRLERDVPAYQTYFELSNLIRQQLGYDDKFQGLVDFIVNSTTIAE
jgi:hypothetical protein